MRQVVLLRGINLGPHNRIAMPKLREVLAAAGHEDVATYVQSGNVVLSSDATPTELAGACKQLISDAFELDIDVVVRTRDELAEVVTRDPLGSVAENPKRYQVTFLAEAPPGELGGELAQLVAHSEQVVMLGREIYAWHPDGVARSKLAAALSSRRLSPIATTRNWRTVNALLEIASA